MTYLYDNADNLTRLTSPYATVIYQYDPANRMLDTTTTTLGKSGVLGFTYDGNDNLKAIRYPSGKTVTYSYNGLNQVTGISGFGGTVSNINYFTSPARASACCAVSALVTARQQRCPTTVAGP